MKRNQILTLALTIILLLQLIPTRPLIPLMQAEAAAMPAGYEPAASTTSSLNTSPLTPLPIPTPFPPADKNVFPANYFDPIKDLDPIPTRPFRKEEFINLAPDRITKGADGKQWVSIRRRKPLSNKPDDYEQVKVPLNRYVEELNEYEEFLNKLGYSLRDGQLANPAGRRVESNMGDVLMLRPREEVLTDKPKCDLPDCWPEFYAYDPNPFHINYTGDLSVLNFERLRVNPADIRGFRRAPSGSRSARGAAQSGMLVPVRVQSTLSADTASTSYQRCGGVRVRLVPLGRNPATGAPRFMMMSFIGDLFDFGVKTFNFDILINASLGYLGCAAGKELGLKIPGCPESGERGSASPTSSEESTKPPDTLRKTEADPKCLYSADGEMLVSQTPMFKADASASDGFGWFAAYGGIVFNLEGRMVADQTHPQLGINHWGQTTLSITVLGLNFKLAEYTKQTSYESQTNPKFSTPPSKFVAILPIIGEVPIEANFHKQIDGPRATFMVGPVPITVESGVEFNAGEINETPNLAQPPLACGESGTGRLELQLGAEAEAKVSLRAKIDAIVASVGIEGSLILMDDRFGGRMVTEIIPDANEIKVTPSVTYDLKHLAGQLRLFVELDLLVYDKKWSVLILDNIGGIDPPSKTFPPKPWTATYFSKKKKT
jgi:hypothetical protein